MVSTNWSSCNSHETSGPPNTPELIVSRDKVKKTNFLLKCLKRSPSCSKASTNYLISVSFICKTFLADSLKHFLFNLVTSVWSHFSYPMATFCSAVATMQKARILGLTILLINKQSNALQVPHIRPIFAATPDSKNNVSRSNY